MRKLSIIKPLFENYTTIDEPIVRLASSYQLYLIGGTVIDMLCRNYEVSNNRNRSNNDIDFCHLLLICLRPKNMLIN